MDDMDKFFSYLKVCYYGVLIVVFTTFFYSTFFLIKQIIPIKENWNLYLISLGIVIIISAYYYYKAHEKLFKSHYKQEIENQTINSETKRIQDFLDRDLDIYTSEELTRMLIEAEFENYLNKSKSGYWSELDKKKEDIEKAIEEAKHKENLQELKDEEKEAKQRIEGIKKEEQDLLRTNIDDQYEIEESLDIENNNVFKKEDLNEKEIEVLLQNDFKQTNEYDVNEKKIINVFVKPVLNHSKTHIFLVWSVKNLLEQIRDIKNIQEHLSVNADITFTYNKKKFALEIEIGNLLKKKVQLKEKLNYLNKKYPDRWMFIVSNQNLVSKYRKHGLSTQRKQVGKNLLKLLKMHTQQN